MEAKTSGSGKLQRNYEKAENGGCPELLPNYSENGLDTFNLPLKAMSMRLHEIIDTLSDNYWLQEIGRLSMHRDAYSPMKEDLNWIETEFEKWLWAGKTGRATNWAVAGFLFYHDEFLSSIRKKGWLRPSKHLFHTKAL